MATLTPPPDATRDQVLHDWETTTSASLVAASRKKKFNGVAIAVVAAAALGVVFWVKGGAAKSDTTTAESQLTVAPRKTVPVLNDDQPAAVVPPVKTATPATPAVDPLVAQRAQLALQQQEKARLLLDARRKSAIEPGGTGAPSTGPAQGAAQNATLAALMGTLGGTSEAGTERGAQDPNSRFARAVSGNGVVLSQASNVTNLEYKILQGKVIEGVTIPRAISDLPGTICALIQRDVYAERGRLKLIPWGSRLCGVYSAEVRKGQSRLFTMWNTLRTANPDGSITEVALDSIGSDQLGTAGMGGIVDAHFAEIFGTSALLSIIGAGAANTGVSSGDQNNSSAQYRQSVQQAAAQTSQSILAPIINIPPTITTPAGSRIRIFVNRDLDFTDIYTKQQDAAQQQDGPVLID
ncbi:TrbI/VirB10 family protein [Glaciimonas sp. Gout2]|uniref:TrbI/VirB10 family protein n=1 Tax=unclassified Glaciimonas TaxID=2644401 RepID=UPI002B226F84|nr:MULTISPECIES: TrbI/VirB10 family protein [unclassified Glaciimonas]MEB0013930.1 TrbI/VirB10 family protein [Glaciimonas sp. Cout2]MEB0083127.1 TrbI/VirB10 family protein [Glaciimonas sp. Gout2]